jgi:hypothetical protein
MDLVLLIVLALLDTGGILFEILMRIYAKSTNISVYFRQIFYSQRAKENRIECSSKLLAFAKSNEQTSTFLKINENYQQN